MGHFIYVELENDEPAAPSYKVKAATKGKVEKSAYNAARPYRQSVGDVCVDF